MAASRRFGELSLELKPPQNLEAEAHLLGSMMYSDRAFRLLSWTVRPEDFYMPAHGEIFRALCAAKGDGSTCPDLVAVKDCLLNRGTLKEIGGQDYLQGLVTRLPDSTKAGVYADIVREKAVLREIENKLRVGIGLVHDPDASQASMAEYIGTITLRDGWLDADSLMMDGEIQSVASGATAPTFALPAPKGLSHVTKSFARNSQGGWCGPGMTVVMARPATGKTVIALDSTVTCANAGHGVVFVSLEMGKTQVAERLLHMVTGFPERWMADRANATAWYLEQADRIGQLPIYMLHTNEDDIEGRSLRRVLESARRAVAETGARMVVIDYVQMLIQDKDHGVWSGDFLGNILAGWARRNDVCLLAVSQVTVNADGSTKARGGGIETAAYDVFEALREKPKADGELGQLVLKCTKRRFGRGNWQQDMKQCENTLRLHEVNAGRPQIGLEGF